jgi:hypothetical protein
MKWFRSNIQHGSRLALFALAIQFALSFGHFHGISAQAAPANQQTNQQAPSNDPDQQPADPCAICAVMALANAVLFATPPVLLLPQAIGFLYLVTDAEFVHPGSVRVAFQPRAPPAS